MLNFEDGTICQCCECHPNNVIDINHQCKTPLPSCKLKYCNFDNILRENASVDCIRESKDGYLVLLEIKNQKSSNIDKDGICKKIIETVKYLKKKEEVLYNKKRLFVLSIPDDKQIDNVSPEKMSYYFKIGNYLYSKTLSLFNENVYYFDIGKNEIENVYSKISRCVETDEICK